MNFIKIYLSFKFYKLISDYELFIMENLYEEIGADIYQNIKLTSNERRKLKDSVDKVNDIIGYITEKTDVSKEYLNYGLLLLVFCYLIFMDKKEIVDNRYYGYKKNLTVNTEISYGNQAHDKAKIYIVQKIFNIYQNLRGFQDEIHLIRKIETNIDEYMSIVFSQHGMDEVLYVHGMLYRKMRRELFFEEAVVDKAKEFILMLKKKTGFECVMVNKESVLYMFRMYYENEDVLNEIQGMFINSLNKTEKNGDVTKYHEREMVDDDGYVSLGRIYVHTSLKDKKFYLLEYKLIM